MPVEQVRPVLWGVCSKDLPEATSLVVVHQFAEHRLELVAAVGETAVDTQLGLEKDMLVAIALCKDCHVFGRTVDVDLWSFE